MKGIVESFFFKCLTIEFFVDFKLLTNELFLDFFSILSPLIRLFNDISTFYLFFNSLQIKKKQS